MGFMGVDMSDALVDIVVNMTSKEFMQEHLEKFDESGIAEEINRKNGAPVPDVPYASAAKVRAFRAPLESEAVIREQLNSEWVAQMAPLSGFNTYDEMRKSW